MLNIPQILVPDCIAIKGKNTTVHLCLKDCTTPSEIMKYIELSHLSCLPSENIII